MARPREVDLDVAVERAMQLFWDRGYEATSTRDLVAATGMGQGSLYHAFGSKHEIFEAALDRYVEAQARGLVAALKDADPVRPAIAAVLDALVDSDLDGDGCRGCLMVNSAAELGATDAIVREKVTSAYVVTETALREALERGRSTGELEDGPEPAALARFLMTTINGLRVVAKASPDPRRLRDTVAVAMYAIG